MQKLAEDVTQIQNKVAEVGVALEVRVLCALFA